MVGEMAVLLHVSIALTSILFTIISYFSPSKAKLWISYSLVGLTLVSGTYLVVSTHANLVSACITGVIYLAIVSFALILAHRKLATENTKD